MRCSTQDTVRPRSRLARHVRGLASAPAPGCRPYPRTSLEADAMTKHLIGTFMTVAGLVALALAGTLTVSAQEATPEGTQSEAHPAHIHSGTCAELGDVVYPLEDVTGGHLEGTPAATPEAADEGLPGDVIAHSRTS